MNANKLFQQLDTLLALEDLSVEGSAKVLDASLLEHDALDMEYYAVAVGGGPAGDVELRTPKPSSGKKQGLLFLSLNGALSVDEDDVTNHYGEPELGLVTANPEGDRMPVYLRYRLHGGELRFAVDQQTNRVLTVILDRTQMG